MSDFPVFPGMPSEETLNSTSITHVDANTEADAADVDADADRLERIAVEKDQDPNSSINLICFGSSTGKQFATPLKLLPPLKDIEPIVTPKSFGVAKDKSDKTHHLQTNVVSSPVATNDGVLNEMDEDPEDAFDGAVNDTFANPSQNAPIVSGFAEENDVTAAALFLGLDRTEVAHLSDDVVSRLAQRAHKFQGIQSELSFFKLNQEHLNQVHLSKYDAFQKEVTHLSLLNETLSKENDALTEKVEQNEVKLTSLKSRNAEISSKLEELESAVKNSQVSHEQTIVSREEEIARLHETVNRLTETNVKLSQLLNQLTKDLNEESNAKFQFKLELTKATNELIYSKKQKDWYSNQLKTVQEKYTELIKKQEMEFLRMSNQITSLTSQNESNAASKLFLESKVKELEMKLESSSAKLTDLESKSEIQVIKFLKEAAANEEMIELVRVQLEEREKRISQLETYAEEIKKSASNSISELQNTLSDKEEKVALLEVRLKRTEEALSAELHKETDLPKMSSSAEKILKDTNSGLSLSALYTEFNLVKKELVLEKSQKEKLAAQLSHFVTELESKKPAIANYRNQVQFYEQSLRDLLEKLNTLRIDKLESDKECSRLRARVANYESEKESLKQLLKDLGRQLCYYLIHSNIRDGKNDPLSASERRVIDQILEKSGALGEGTSQTDTDILITERLVAFSSVIELQKKNEELLVAIRQLGRELEEKDSDTNGIGATAVEEAKDAISTLQSELESVNIRLDAVTKERDLMKLLNNGENAGSIRGTDMKVLTESNSELKLRVKDLDRSLKLLQTESLDKIHLLTQKLLEESSSNEKLKLQIASIKHSVELAESRLSHTKSLLDNSQKLVEHTRTEVNFWKQQASKQEDMLVKKSNDLRDEEQKAFEFSTSLHNLKVEKEQLVVMQTSLKNDNDQLREDKKNLASFIAKLQSLLEEREKSANDISSKLAQSVINYQTLQDRINEKDERLQVLASQSELSLKAQNSKLEQVNELSQKLLETKTKLAEKQALVERLKSDLDNKSRPEPTSNRNSDLNLNFDSGSNSVPLSEFEDLKQLLKDAELQVQEFTNIARVSEDALDNATKSYEEYRHTTEATLKLLEQDKEELTYDLREKERDIGLLRDQLKSLEEGYRAEILTLQSQLQETSFKAQSYDEMKTDMDQKFEALASDLSNQVLLYDDLVKRHESKLLELELLNQQVSQQKDEIEQLRQSLGDATAEIQAVRHSITSNENSLNDKLSGKEEELQVANAKIADLQYQYNLALNQIELKSSIEENGDTGANEDLRQVVRFLRHERDASEARNILLSNDVTRLKAEIDSITVELNATKAQIKHLQVNKLKVDESVKEHSRLMEQLEQLNILRESNVTLRNETQNLKLLVTLYEAKIKELEEKAITHSVSDDVNVDLNAQELTLLKEENDRLKGQLGNNEEYKILMQRFENLKSEFKTKLMNHRSKNKELEKLILDLKATQEASERRLAELKSQNANDISQKLSAQFTKMEAEKDVAIKKLQGDITKLKEEYERKLSESKPASDETTASDLKKLKEEHEAKLASLRKEHKLNMASINKSHEQTIASINKDHEDRMKSLKTEFEKKLEDEKKAITESLEKKNDFKLRVLNRKLDRLEKEKATFVSLQSSVSSIQQPNQQDSNNKRQFPAGENEDRTKKIKE